MVRVRNELIYYFKSLVRLINELMDLIKSMLDLLKNHVKVRYELGNPK
jgi:hypothetical protein